MMMRIIFWSSVFLIFYAYIGYPLMLIGLSFARKRPVKKGDFVPRVSFIVTAYNEAKRIRQKIENTLTQDYPKHLLEILVASDSSNDQTDKIVKSYELYGVRLVRTTERKGKEASQKRAVEVSSGEILIFSDVGTTLLPNGVSNIVSNFADLTVGCVSSVDRVIDRDGRISSEGHYVRYEMFVRKLEMEVNTLVGLSGSLFAARRNVCEDWPVDLQSDFNTSLNGVRMGLRSVCDPSSIGYYKSVATERRDFERKARTVLRGISVVMKNLKMLNPFRYGLFSWQLFSHKLCRWLVPFAMILALFSNAVLREASDFYGYALAVQVVFYLTAFGGIWGEALSRKSLLRIPLFFVLANLSILSAWYRYVLGERMVSWNPSER